MALPVRPLRERLHGRPFRRKGGPVPMNDWPWLHRPRRTAVTFPDVAIPGASFRVLRTDYGPPFTIDEKRRFIGGRARRVYPKRRKPCTQQPGT